jgi:hypothetical protein
MKCLTRARGGGELEAAPSITGQSSFVSWQETGNSRAKIWNTLVSLALWNWSGFSFAFHLISYS